MAQPRRAERTATKAGFHLELPPGTLVLILRDHRLAAVRDAVGWDVDLPELVLLSRGGNFLHVRLCDLLGIGVVDEWEDGLGLRPLGYVEEWR